jgi:hypothetical protein
MANFRLRGTGAGSWLRFAGEGKDPRLRLHSHARQPESAARALRPVAVRTPTCRRRSTVSGHRVGPSTMNLLIAEWPARHGTEHRIFARPSRCLRSGVGAQIVLLCAATTAAQACGSRGSPVGDGHARGPPPGRCWPAGVDRPVVTDWLGSVAAQGVWVKWRVGACSSAPESASAPSPASLTTASWPGSGCPAPSPNSLRASFKAGPVPAVAPALADGWSY